ncbi:EamA-like transporter family [Musa troglodytarum]|uniref:WAT1-related protein n=1 Tax=Musa troglodytarum TaxID=320322 RepID=A0A9E7G237_9LILI|nr:EamA-like transporter family [Musa troglodytarum]
MPYLGAMDPNYKPYIAAVIIQLTYTGYFVISKAAFDEGLSTFVFIFYRQAAASVLLAPLAFVFERNTSSPLTFMVSLKLFMHAMLGITLSLNLYNIGVKYTSASVASATTNSVPVYTFFFAVLFRMETMKVKRISGIAKAVGIALCVAGVVMTALYRGSHIHPLNLHGSSGHHTSPTHQKAALPKTTWIEGTLFMITSNITWSLWLVLQGMLLKEYTSKLLFATLECLFATFQSLFVAIAFERDSSKWKLQWDMGLLAILYSGLVVTGVCFYLQTFCVEKKGPVFSAIFTPLNLVFTMICSSVFLGEMISVGSILGGLLMVGGLYGVVWGKSKERAVCQVSIEDGKPTHAAEGSNTA